MLTNSYCCIDTSSSDMRGVFYYMYMYMYMLILLPKLLLTRKFIAYFVFFIGGMSIGKQHISSLTCTLYDYLYVNLFSCVGSKSVNTYKLSRLLLYRARKGHVLFPLYEHATNMWVLLI